MTTAEKLTTAAAEYAEAYKRLAVLAAERDHLIVQRHAEGASLRTIANEAGVSHQTVVNIIRRHGA